MNPLYLAMMQQQEQQSTPMPGMPTSAPTAPLQMMPQQPASPSYTNPFDSGISKAIEGARASIAMSQAQKQDAFSKSLAAFAAAMSQPQQQYWGDDPRSAMMRQLGASLAPGMQTYNQAEDQARQENLGMADYMVKLKSTQDEALRKALKEIRDRKHQQDVLEEQKRSHNLADEHHQETTKENRRYHDLMMTFQKEKIKDASEQKKQTKLEKKIGDDQYTAAEAEYRDLLMAKDLLNKGDPLRGTFFSFFHKPQALKNADEAAFDVLASDMKGQTYKRFKYRNQAEFKNIKEIDPTLGKNENLAIIDHRLKQIEPLIEKKKQMEAMLRGEEGGTDLTDMSDEDLLREYNNGQ